jgi:Na+/H+ antiporter NhaD/arsenite permease-like protein
MSRISICTFKDKEIKSVFYHTQNVTNILKKWINFIAFLDFTKHLMLPYVKNFITLNFVIFMHFIEQFNDL